MQELYSGIAAGGLYCTKWRIKGACQHPAIKAKQKTNFKKGVINV